MWFRAVTVAVLLCTAFLSRAVAHHTYAMFDRTQRITLVGDVTAVEIENPHGWLRVMVRDAQGQTVVWSFEMGAPGALRRQGWMPGMLQRGDHVTVQFHPMKDGSAAGQLISVVFPDGKKFAGGPTGGDTGDER
ncbi:MAG: hypothetical protein JO128_12955 [Alphaproteobacteria bacterium]|nr:hypothetical protein [Alphaproteobacteria bacterium]